MRGREHYVRNEVRILEEVSKGHLHIVTLHEYFETPNSLYLVMDLCLGGELFDRIVEKGNFFEEDAAEIIKIVVDCVAYLHEWNIVHRDIKPENLLFRSKDSLSELMIADFGLSRILETSEFLLSTSVGTPNYMAPELFTRNGHGKPVDMWAIGVMTYFLLCGYFPFAQFDGVSVDRKILLAEFSFEPEENWREISAEGKDFISKLIRLNPDDRMTAADTLKHPWMDFAPIPLSSGGSIASRVPTIDLLPTVRSEFSKRSTVRRNTSIKATEANKNSEEIVDTKYEANS